MSTALTQHPWKLHGLCGDFPWAPPTQGKREKSNFLMGKSTGANVTVPDIRVDNNIPVILGPPVNAASALLFPL